MSIPVRQHALLRETRRPRIYTVSFAQSGMEGVGERQDAARGLVAGVSVGGGAVRNDFDRIPIFQRPICNATWDHTERKWRDFVWQGEADFTWSPTEPYREVLYRCRPFWYKMDMSGTYNPASISVTDAPLEGFLLAPMFKNGTDFVYRPCFQAGLGADGLLHSRAGLAPFIARPRKLMESARAYDSCAHTETYRDLISDWMLMVVEFANRRLQDVMWGRIRAPIQDSYIDLLPSGAALSKSAASSGTPTNDGYAALFWRGKENAWGNAASYICDFSPEWREGENYRVFYLPDPTKWSSERNEHYEELTSEMMFRNYTWVHTWRTDPKYPWFLLPADFSSSWNRGTASALHGGNKSNLCVFASGYSYTVNGVSPIKFTITADIDQGRFYQCGARLILEEGRDAAL